MKRYSHIIGIGLLTLMSSVTLAGTTQVGTANVKLPFVALESGTTPETFKIKVADGNGKVSSFEDQIRAMDAMFKKSIEKQSSLSIDPSTGTYGHVEAVATRVYGHNARSAWPKPFNGAYATGTQQYTAAASLTADGNLQIIYKQIDDEKLLITTEFNYFTADLPKLVFDRNITLTQTVTVIPKLKNFSTIARQNKEGRFAFSGFDEKTNALEGAEPNIKLAPAYLADIEKSIKLTDKEQLIIARVALSELVEKHDIKRLPFGLNSDVDFDSPNLKHTLNLHYATIIDILKEQR